MKIRSLLLCGVAMAGLTACHYQPNFLPSSYAYHDNMYKSPPGPEPLYYNHGEHDHNCPHAEHKTVVKEQVVVETVYEKPVPTYADTRTRYGDGMQYTRSRAREVFAQ